jgi:glyoxylase-like metal-dependent hydrolase (beta-lactamase superfamily II)
MEVANGIRRMGSRYTNFYLIEDRGKLTLLDAGLPGYWSHLVHELAAIGRRVEDIDAVLITHRHPDHVGVAERVRRAGSARVYSHAEDAPFVSGEQSSGPPNFLAQLWRPFVFGYLVHSVMAGAPRPMPVAGVETFADGEVVDVPGRPRVIHTPGHTAGQCALLLEERGVLFSADALVTCDLLSGRPGPAIPPEFVNSDSRQALRSVAALESVDATVMLPGHGEPWRYGIKEAVRLARQRALPRTTSPRPALV